MTFGQGITRPWSLKHEETKMGCDIHWHTETRNSEGVWLCDQRDSYKAVDKTVEDHEYDSDEMDNFPGRGRDYWLFGLLSKNVRTDWPWSFEAKGLPDDISEHANLILGEQWAGDLHSMSWLTRAELRAKLIELKHAAVEYLIAPPASAPDAPKYLADQVETILANMEALDTTGNDDDQRLVFGFDN